MAAFSSCLCATAGTLVVAAAFIDALPADQIQLSLYKLSVVVRVPAASQERPVLCLRRVVHPAMAQFDVVDLLLLCWESLVTMALGLLGSRSVWWAAAPSTIPCPRHKKRCVTPACVA